VNANANAAPHRACDVSQITARNTDEAISKVKQMLADKKLPPARSINCSRDNTLLVYCGHTQLKAEPARSNETIVWSRPSGPKRL